MKRVLFLTALVSSAAFSDPRPESENLELCTVDACAIPVQTKELQGTTVYLVKSLDDYQKLSAAWTGGVFFVASEADYDELKIGRESFMLPMILRAKGTTSGPLVTGTINVNVNTGGGGKSCADCHTGSWKEIHAGVMAPKKIDNGR